MFNKNSYIGKNVEFLEKYKKLKVLLGDNVEALNALSELRQIGLTVCNNCDYLANMHDFYVKRANRDDFVRKYEIKDRQICKKQLGRCYYEYTHEVTAPKELTEEQINKYLKYQETEQSLAKLTFKDVTPHRTMFTYSYTVDSSG